jgi:hypothetical protein
MPIAKIKNLVTKCSYEYGNKNAETYFEAEEKNR